MLKLIILLLLVSCSKPSPEQTPLNEELIIEGEALTLAIDDTGITPSEMRDVVFPPLIEGESAKILIGIKNNASSVKNLVINEAMSNFTFSSNCAQIKRNRTCYLTLTNVFNTPGTYTDAFTIDNEQFLVSSVVSPKLSSFFQESLRISETNISLNLTNDVTVKRIIVTNTKSIIIPFTLEIPANVEVILNSCQTQLKNLRFCVLDFKFTKSNLANGTSTKVAKVNGLNINFNLNVVNSVCESDARVSASECDADPVVASLQKNTINTTLYPEAVCNDGSPAVFYFRPGTGSGANRWVIHLEEGGFCGLIPVYFGTSYFGSFNNCPDRQATMPYYVSSTLSGTEAYYPVAYNYNDGILSRDANKNPDFYTWNHVEVRYCSSDLWSGENTQVISGSPFIFKGTKIIDAVVSELKNSKNLDNAKNIILTGSSAGGIGIINQGDRIKNTHLNDKDVVMLSDSGFLFNYNNPSNAPVFSTLFDLNHSYFNAKPDESCVARTGDPESCHFASVNHEDITVPKFIIQDQLDDFYLSVINQVDLCSSSFSDSWINGYTSTLRDSLSSEDGAVSLRYKQHVYINNSAWKLPLVQGTTSISEVFSNWYFNKAGVKKYIEPDLGTIRAELNTLCN